MPHTDWCNFAARSAHRLAFLFIPALFGLRSLAESAHKSPCIFGLHVMLGTGMQTAHKPWKFSVEAVCDPTWFCAWWL